MDETRFLMLMKKARNFSHLGGRPHYWHGYQRGLRRGFHGELFGTDEEHTRWMRLADDGANDADRERGRGYRDALVACVATDDGALTAIPSIRGSIYSEMQGSRFSPSRR